MKRRRQKTAIATWNALGAQAEESWGQSLLGKAIMAVREDFKGDGWGKGTD